MSKYSVRAWGWGEGVKSSLWRGAADRKIPGMSTILNRLVNGVRGVGRFAGAKRGRRLGVLGLLIASNSTDLRRQVRCLNAENEGAPGEDRWTRPNDARGGVEAREAALLENHVLCAKHKREWILGGAGGLEEVEFDRTSVASQTLESERMRRCGRGLLAGCR